MTHQESVDLKKEFSKGFWKSVGGHIVTGAAMLIGFGYWLTSTTEASASQIKVLNSRVERIENTRSEVRPEELGKLKYQVARAIDDLEEMKREMRDMRQEAERRQERLYDILDDIRKKQ